MADRNNAAAVCRVSGITDGDSNDKKNGGAVCTGPAATQGR